MPSCVGFVGRKLNAFASFIIPGLGQAIKGELGRGGLTFVISIIIGISGALLRQVSMIGGLAVSVIGLTFGFAQVLDAYGKETLPY